MAFECVTKAWQCHKTELQRFLMTRLGDEFASDDILQEVFFKAMRSGSTFCELDNPRAWLFEVARNAITDRHRLAKHWVPVPEDLVDGSADSEEDPVVLLENCLQTALGRLAPADRDILQQCDLAGTTQSDYAQLRCLSLPATKARILRARKRLREDLVQHCGVQWDSTGKVCCHRALSSLR